MSLISKLTTIAAAGGGAPEIYWVVNVPAVSSSYSNYSSAAPLRSGSDIFVLIRSQGTNGTTTYAQSALKMDAEGDVSAQRSFVTSTSGLGGNIVQKSDGDLIIPTRDVVSGKLVTAAMAVPSTLGASTDSFATTGNTNNMFTWASFGDGSDNVYVIGAEDYYTGSGFTNVWLINKYNSSLNLTYSKRYYFTLSGVRNCVAYNGIADSSDNAIIVGSVSTDDRTSDSAHLAKFTSSGAIVFDKRFYQSNSTSSRGYFRDVVEDDAGNYYAVGYLRDYSGTITSGDYMGIIVKYNSSGVLQWYRGLGDTGMDVYLFGIDIDDTGNVVFSGYTDQNTSIVGSLDSSGSENYIYTLARSNSTSYQSLKVSADAFGNVMVSSQGNDTTTAKSEVDIYKLPADGSITGTFGDYTIAASGITLRASIGTIVDASPAMSIQDTGLTKSAISVSENTTAFSTSTTTVE